MIEPHAQIVVDLGIIFMNVIYVMKVFIVVLVVKGPIVKSMLKMNTVTKLKEICQKKRKNQI
tara:strand:+ start:383 stop:568 length:186 start_codon:yes stop_codon:yes gene_type:complete